MILTLTELRLTVKNKKNRMVIIVFMMLIMIMTTMMMMMMMMMMMIRYKDQYKEDKERGTRIAGVIIVLLTFFFLQCGFIAFMIRIW